MAGSQLRWYLIWLIARSSAASRGPASRLAWVSSSPPCRAARVPSASRSTSVSSCSSPRSRIRRSPSRIGASQRSKPAASAVRAGSLVSASSLDRMVAGFGLDGMALYGSTKAALKLLTKAWSAEFGPKGIRVNAVAPGPVSTEGTEGMREAQGYLASLAPARRLGTPEEIAAAIVYLASPQAAFTHGVVLPVDGGRVAV